MRRTVESLWAAAQMAFHIVFGPAVHGWRARWGAARAEIERPLPGDELVPAAARSYNHAMTIDAPRSAVWPWLLQLGQGRGGFYSYEGLENLARCDIHNVSEIRPELQQLRVGDRVRTHSSGYSLEVAVLEPQRALVLADRPSAEGPRATWAFYLLDGPNGTTRLLERGRNAGGRWWLEKVGTYLVESIGFVMSKKMLRTIKQLAEGARAVAPRVA